MFLDETGSHLGMVRTYARAPRGERAVGRAPRNRGRTRTTISPLADSDRVNELAAMLRGDSAAEGTRREARAMLVEARTAA